MKRTSGQVVSASMHHGKVYSPDDAAPINLMRRCLLSSSPSSGCEPAAASGNGVRVAGDWEQRVDRPVFRLVDAACVRFPHVYGEGRRLKGSVKKPLPGRTRVSLTTAWMHPSTTGRGLRAVYVSETHPLIHQHKATTGRHQPGHAQPEEGGQAVQPGRVPAEGPDRGRLWGRGEQEAPAALPVRPDGQPPAVRQGKGHRMERAGAQPVRVGQQAEGTNPVIRRTTDARGVRLTLPSACGRACSVAGSGNDGLTGGSPGWATVETGGNYAPTPPKTISLNIMTAYRAENAV